MNVLSKCFHASARGIFSTYDNITLKPKLGLMWFLTTGVIRLLFLEEKVEYSTSFKGEHQSNKLSTTGKHFSYYRDIR